MHRLEWFTSIASPEPNRIFMTVFAPARSERHLFEAWCNVPGLKAISMLPGTSTYASQVIQKSWGAWQARAALSTMVRLSEPGSQGSKTLDSANVTEPDGLFSWNEWIQVDDRLPGHTSPVLVVIVGKRNQPPRVSMATHWELGKGFSGTDPEWMEGSNAFLSSRVTHWMALTMPPGRATQPESGE
jgi:hypothetical protein